MDTWILMVDEGRASLLVVSHYGPLYEIEDWKRCGNPRQSFVEQVSRRLAVLQGHFDRLVVAGPPALLEGLRLAYTPELRRKVVGQVPRYLTHLDRRQLRDEIQQILRGLPESSPQLARMA